MLKIGFSYKCWFFFILMCVASTYLFAQEAVANNSNFRQDWVLLHNKGKLMPYTDLVQKPFFLLQNIENSSFLPFCNRYVSVQTATLDSQLPTNAQLIFWVDTEEDIDQLPTKPEGGSLVVVLNRQSLLPSLQPKMHRVDALWLANVVHPSLDILSQLFFGGRAASAKLRKDLGANFPKGFGLQTAKNRLGYASMSQLGWDSSSVQAQVDSVMQLGIEKQAFPGAQLLVAKKGMVVFHKTYGHHTYAQKTTVGKNDVYDLASVTKITTALPAIMQLYDQKKIDLDQPFSKYWKPWQKRKDKKELTLRQILAHQAGLKPYIVFLAKAMRKGKLKKRFIKTIRDSKYPIQAYDSLYIHPRFHRKMQRMINRSVVSKQKKYRYSGLSFLIYPKLVKQLTGSEFSTYLQKQFYQALGAHTMGFNPKKRAIPYPIVPTEMDSVFRKTRTHAWVHDENAALMGGISGNAGLFSNANDLAKLLQMYLQKGSYGGKQYISANTLSVFSRIQYRENGNRRGLGFDKPLIGNDTLSLKEAYPAPLASKESYGHAGFTGTFVWVDPKAEMVFIFLSNRVYPSRTHRALYDLNIRPALQQIFYMADK
ncbi:MAG: beta-lactamase family protein [Flavobacteriaceae bacterium]|nr:beta-lactamase family protein [Flavobacteriaceae bacterium]